MEDDLDLKNRKMLELHLQECDGCHQLFKSFQSSVGLYEHLEKEPCPPGLEQKLKGIIQEKIQMKKQN